LTTEIAEPLDLNELVSPLVATIKKLDDEIELLETTVSLKKAQRIKYRGVLRQLDPDQVKPLYAQKPGKNGGGKKRDRSGSSSPSQEILSRLTDWFQANKAMVNGLNEGQGIFSTGAAGLEGFPIQGAGQQSRTSKAFRILQDQGILRLASIGGVGARKYYKVI
jgi:hypothetical protein